MQELSLNFPTVVILLVILALAVHDAPRPVRLRRPLRRWRRGLRRLLPLRFGRSTDRFKPHQRHGCR